MLSKDELSYIATSVVGAMRSVDVEVAVSELPGSMAVVGSWFNFLTESLLVMEVSLDEEGHWSASLRDHDGDGGNMLDAGKVADIVSDVHSSERYKWAALTILAVREMQDVKDAADMRWRCRQLHV